MGCKHNTHIYNDSDETVRVVLTDNNNRNTIRFIDQYQLICIPTVHGTNTVSVFQRLDDGKFSETADSCYTDESDRSLIIVKTNNGLEIVRSKYGHVKVIDEKAREE